MSNAIKLDSFKDILSWLLNMRNDDIRSKFCIIRAELTVNTELDSNQSIFLKTIEDNMRTSDLVAKDANTYWCLLPTDNLDALERRIKEVIELATRNKINSGDYKISSYSFPRYSLSRVKDGNSLLTTLKEETMVKPDKQIELTIDNSGDKDVHVVPLFVN